MTLDFELTNHCNARCGFCPRDAMPHEGKMSPRTFAQALARAVELRTRAARLGIADEPRIVFCGTGEPLLNPHAVEFVRRITRAGFGVTLSTNGALLDHSLGGALLDAGLGTIVVNASEIGDDYERIYRVPFARTRDNVADLVVATTGRCALYIAVVDHAGDPARVQRVTDYWQRLGVTRFIRYALVNRGGSLRGGLRKGDLDAPDFATMPEVDAARALLASRGLTPVCGAPFVHMFVGFDGLYYLCSSDWRKEVPLGSVFDDSFAAVTALRLEHVRTRSPICKRCSVDPVNRLAARLRAAGTDPAGRADVDALIDEIAAVDRVARQTARETAATAEATELGPLAAEPHEPHAPLAASSVGAV